MVVKFNTLINHDNTVAQFFDKILLKTKSSACNKNSLSRYYKILIDLIFHKPESNITLPKHTAQCLSLPSYDGFLTSILIYTSSGDVISKVSKGDHDRNHNIAEVSDCFSG
uniref:Uncharacterized protein n=1 Tax=Clastoptera arizonana TaxID=38151 RepID=A0A1B6C475_9HEMI